MYKKPYAILTDENCTAKMMALVRLKAKRINKLICLSWKEGEGSGEVMLFHFKEVIS